MQAQSTDSSVNKFTTPEAQEEFIRLMGKSITKERGFLPSSGDGGLLLMIQARGGSRCVRHRSGVIEHCPRILCQCSDG